MKNWKRGLAAILFVAVVFTTCFSQNLVEVNAAELDNLGTYLGKTDSDSQEGIGRADTFTETFEGGLNLDKWEVVKYKSSYIADFEVVDDPIAGEKQGKVLTTNRPGAWLIPKDAYYPNGSLWGELSTIEYKVYFKDIKSVINGTSGQTNEYCPGVAFRVVTDNKDGETLARRVDGFLAYSSIKNEKTGIGVSNCASFKGISTNGIDRLSTFGYISPDYEIGTGNYTTDFNYADWITVKITVDKAGNATGVFKDSNGASYTADCGRYNQSGGKIALGYMPRGVQGLACNFKVSDQEWGGQLYLDDIKVTFQPSDFDKDADAKDVNVYYEGNTYIKAGDTVSLTGERLGSSVLSAQFTKLTDDAVTMANAKYVEETHYDAYYDVDADDLWSKINKGTTILDSATENGIFQITQRSELGLNMIIPEEVGDGMYAILLKAASEGSANELVIINNPRITLLMGNDGDCATKDGWIKLGGENLSVQDDISKVSAIITDEAGNPLYLLQGEDKIYVDTTENYGAENEHYMKVSLKGLNLEDGKTYQVMVHNGFGGDYGWSMPHEFTYKAEAANTAWKKKGTFNVLDYGAVGDGEANDTAAIQCAINAAVENGGGVVYFPKRANGDTGYYRITNGLIVKENISLIGEGESNTKIYYDGFFKTSPDQTEYMISYEKNFEVTGLELFCNTNYFSAAIKKKQISDSNPGKLYIHDVKVYLDATAWRDNAFEPTLPKYDGKTSSEWYELQWLNMKKYFIDCSMTVASHETFILWENVNQDLRSCGTSKGLTAKYIDVYEFEEISNYDRCTYSASVACFEENCHTSNLLSHAVQRSPYMANTECNNREVFLCDTGGVNTTRQFRYIDKDTFKDDLTLLFEGWSDANLKKVKDLAGEKEGRVFYSSGSLAVGDELAVTDGEEGVGQIRTVEDVVIINKVYFVVVNKEFACNPNRNSTVSRVNGKPNHTYICNGNFEDGTCAAVYGLAWDIVFSGCNIKDISLVSFAAHYSGFIWYGSLNKIIIDGTDYVHNDKPGEMAMFFLSNGDSISGVVFLGMRYSNSKLISNDAHVQIIRGNTARKYNAYNLVVENLEIISEIPAVQVDSSGAGGILVHNVRQFADETDKANSEISPYRNRYNAKSALSNGNMWADNLLPEWAKMKGDLNQDDIVSRKDLEVMRDYLAGKTELEKEVLTAANMNGDYNGSDAIIDARDYLYLKAVIKYRDDETALANAIAAIGKTKILNKDANFSILLDYSKTEEED